MTAIIQIMETRKPTKKYEPTFVPGSPDVINNMGNTIPNNNPIREKKI